MEAGWQVREGVFIPRRDTNSRFNELLGGRVFPGIFQRSRFEPRETDRTISIRIIRHDGETEIDFAGHVADELSPTSIFPSLEEAAGFFSLGATGYSATCRRDHYHGMELEALDWSVQPLEIEQAESCFFNDRERFPAGAAELDCALLMRHVEHEWHSRPDLYHMPQAAGLSTRAPSA